MGYYTGTATGYLDLLAKLVTFATGRGLASAAVNNDGSGYAAGDVVSVNGGTHSVTATVEITSVDGGGNVTGIRVVQTGVYTVDPTTTGNAVTGGTGTGLTLNLTMEDTGWTKNRESFYAVSAVITAAGTGYSVGNLLFVSGGTFVDEGAAFTVTSVGGSGTVTGVSLLEKGEYTTAPSNPAATTDNGPGSGCTLTVTYEDDKNYLLEGEGSGSDEIFVGIRSYEATGAHNWELSGMTGYSSGSKFIDQPGISPGRFDFSEHGHYVPLNNASLTFWIFVTGRRIAMVAKMGSTYVNMYLGLLNAFATEDEYPYPLMVAGCSSLFDRQFNSSSISLSGLTDYIGHQSTLNAGPASIRDPGGSWKQVLNSKLSAGSRVAMEALVAFPCGNPTRSGVSAANDGSIGTHTTIKLVPNDSIPGVAAYTMNQTPGSSYRSPLWPVLLMEASPVRQILGELDGVYWVSADGESTDLLTEDSIEAAGFFHHVFQNCNRTDLWSHLAIRRI